LTFVNFLITGGIHKMNRTIISLVFFLLLSRISGSDPQELDDLIRTSPGRKRKLNLINTTHDPDFSLVLPVIEESSETSVSGRALTPHPNHQSKKSRAAEDQKQFAFKMTQKFQASKEEAVESSGLPKKEEKSADSATHSWKLEFMNLLQADDPERLAELISKHPEGTITADFRILSPLNPSTFTYPLQFALQHKLLDVADFIISDVGFNANAKDSYGHTAISLALEKGYFSQFTSLLPLSDLNVEVLDGLNLVHLAASMQCVSPIFLSKLHESGADFTASCKKNNWTTLQYAVVANNTVLVNWINENTKCNLTEDPRNSHILLLALKNKHYKLASKLISLKAVQNCVDKDNGKNILHYIAESKSVGLLSLIDIEKLGRDAGLLSQYDLEQGFCPEHYATQVSFVTFLDVIREYVDLDSNLTASGKTILEVAIESGSSDVLKYLLEHELIESFEDVIIDIYKNSPGYSDQFCFIEMILDYVIDTDQDDEFLYSVDSDNLNVLHLAIINDDMKFITELVEAFGFDVNNFNYSSMVRPANSPLSWAIFLRKPKIVKYLMEKGAGIRERLRISSFSPNEDPSAGAVIKDEEDIVDLNQLAGLFGDSEIQSLIKSRSDVY
jgi:ankyrin repeat protein